MNNKYNSDIIEITSGEYVNINVALHDSKASRSFDLAGYDQFKVCIKAQDNSFINLTQTANANGSVVTKATPDSNGELVVEMFPADSALLKVNCELDFFIEISKSTDSPAKPLRKVLKRALYVHEFGC